MALGITQLQKEDGKQSDWVVLQMASRPHIDFQLLSKTKREICMFASYSPGRKEQERVECALQVH